MSRRLLLALAALLIFSQAATQARALGPLHHTSKKPAKEQIEDLEQTWRAATLNGDAIALAPLLSDDYVGISWSGQLNTKDTQLDRLRTRAIKLTRLDFTDMKVKVVNTVAIVTAKAQVEGNSEGKDTSGAYIYTRIYQRNPAGQWLITNFEATRLPNGKRAQQRAAATPAATPVTQ